jgi:predicted phage terminase large subunit-like protein
MKEKHNVKCVVLETAGVGEAIGAVLRKRADSSRWLRPHNPALGKVERAIAETPKVERKRVYLPVSAPWLETFEAEVASFAMSKYFDQVDSMVQFLKLHDHRNRWTLDLSAVREFREQPF